MCTSYQVVKYAEQNKPGQPGVSAGMWCVVRTIKDDFAFTESNAKACELVRKLEAADKALRDDKCLTPKHSDS